MSDYEVLNKINSPADVKKLNAAERKELAAEMRAAILNRVSKIGGHLGPNLGTVELAIACIRCLILRKTRLFWMSVTKAIRISC